MKPTQIEMTDWMSASQAARALGVTNRRVRQMTAARQLDYEQTPFGRMYRRRAILEFAEARKKRRKKKELIAA